MAARTNKEVCCICLNDFDDARIIDCSHSFCFKCLEDYLRKSPSKDNFRCPLCRREIAIPVCGIYGFKPKVNIENRLSINIPQCDVCTYIVSTFRCKDCEQYVCESCKTMHDKLKICKDHRVIRCDDLFNIESGADRFPNEELTSPGYFCSDHRQKRVEFYCKDCLVAVCPNCYVINHNGHRFLNLQDENDRQEIREELKTLNEELKTQIDQLEKFSESLSMRYTEVMQPVQTACDKVDEQINTICKNLQKLGEHLKDKMMKSHNEDISDEVHVKFRKKMENTKRLENDLKDSVKYTVNVINYSAIDQVLQRLSEVRKERDQWYSRKLDLPDVRCLSFQVAEIDTTLLTNQIGKMMNYNTNMFEDIFNVNNIQTSATCYGKKHQFAGFTWSIGVHVSPFRTPSLLVGFEVNNVEDKRIISCTVDVTVKLININNCRQSIGKQSSETLKIGGWSFVHDLIDWKKFSNPANGFINDGFFTVQVTFDKITDIKRCE